MEQAIMQDAQPGGGQAMAAQGGQGGQKNDLLLNIILAGQKIMYDEKTRHILMEGLSGEAPVAQKIAMQIVGVIKMMDDRAKPMLPRNLIIPAALALMMDLASFIKEGGTPIKKEDLQQAGQMIIKAIMLELGGKTQEQQPVAADQQPGMPEQQEAAGQPGGIMGAMQ